LSNYLRLKRKSGLAPAIVAVLWANSSLSVGGTATPYVGVQFVLNGPALLPSAVAGFFPQNNFNPIFINAGAGANGTTGDLVDANGDATVLTLTHSSNDGFHSGAATNTANGTLLRGEDKSGSGGQSSAPGLTASYTFNNVPAGNYDVIAYIENDVAGVNANVTLGTTTNYVTDESVFAVTPPFALANNTDLSNRVTGNYVEFFGVAPVAGAITLTNTSEGGANNSASINGLQLVQDPVQDPSPIWSGQGSDENWSTGLNWDGNAPAAASSLTFTGNLQTSNTNDFPANTPFDGLNFDANAGAFILGGNAIQLTGDIVNQSPSLQTVNIDLALQQNTNFEATSGNLTVGGQISGAFGITISGSSTVTLMGTNNTYSGGTNVSAGQLVIGSAGALPANSAVTITGGNLQLGANTGGETLSSLTISGTGTFDIGNNHFLLSYSGASPATTIVSEIKTGKIFSSTGKPGYGVAFGDGADGQAKGISSGTIKVSYTLFGDINQDLVVNGTDFSILAGNFGKSVTGGWEQGDMNYDGTVNGTDFGLLAGNFGKSASGVAVALPASQWAALDSFAAGHGLLADVPEPASGFASVIGTLGLLTPRRRSKPQRP
jgi:autotransporter-associated beta strand protein